jgi:hypothetical protein
VTSSFEAHLQEVCRDLEERRGALLEELSSLDDGALPLARPGGWTIAKVMDHIIGSEWHYARLAGQLRGLEVRESQHGAVSSVPGAVGALAASRKALLSAIEGVSEADFYRLGALGREEYSVVSVLENVAQHDHEHLEQIRRIHATVPL